jgi:predicted ATP-grasp superfamily ATP-dependent carboligase
VTPRTALVLDGGSGPALAVVRSLGRAGWRVLAPAGTRSAASRYTAASVALPDPEREPDAFTPAVAALLEIERVDVVVPCTDASAILLHSHGELPAPARVLGGRPGQVLRLADKAACLRDAEDAGFPVPRWGAPATLDEALALAARLGYPCVVKPRHSYVRVGSELVHRRHRVVVEAGGLAAAYDELTGDEPPLLQSLVPGRAMAVGAVRHHGELVGWVARETLSFHPVAGGTSVWKRTVPPDEGGVQVALGLLGDLDYEGLAEVEYQLGPDGTPRLMEVGVRAFGWLPLAMAAGVDLPLLAARALSGERPSPVSGYRAGVEMRWPAGELLRLRDAVRGRNLPAGVSRRDVARSAWPPWRAGMRYDGLVGDDWGPWAPGRIRRYAPAIAAPTVGEANRAPSTNRAAGPNRPSAAKPTKYSPGTDER